MNQPVAVQRVECREGRQRNGDGILQRQRSIFQPGREWLAFEQFHRNVELPVLRPDVVQLADVGVIHARARARLTAQPLG